MKKTLPILIALFAYVSVNGQIFSDNFDSYADGDLIAQTSPDWTTWGNAPGGAEDTPVSSAQAFSGANSLYLESPSGGPTDIVLPFGQQYVDGIFTFDMMMYVPSGKAAYFNIQGEETIGQIWSLQYFLGADGMVDFRGDGNSSLGLDLMAYPQDQWFSIKVVANLSFNEWEVFVDGNSGGVFANANNYLASLNLYPTDAGGGGAASEFYVDDVSFDHEEVMLLDLDATMVSVNSKPAALTGRNIPVIAEVKNVGANPITSMDISWTDGTNTYTDNLTGLNIASLENYQVELGTPYTVLEGSQSFTVTIDAVNGGDDGDLSNNSADGNVTGYTAAANRKVLVEEGTGTWCGFCPRGEVILGLMNDEYPDHFVSIAVHAGSSVPDPMEVAGYPGGLGFTAYPTMSISREEVFGFGVLADVEDRFFQRITEAPDATLSAGATLDGNNNLTLTAHADFLNSVSGDHRLAMVLVEDGVTGTGSGYNQVNYYAGGGLGPMGGYENLPDPVPAAQMVYDHVGRAIFGGTDGESGSLPASNNMGDTPSYEFESVAVDNEWNLDNMKVVTMLLNPDGSVNNVAEQNLSDILVLTSVEDAFSQVGAKVYPNPFQGEAFIELNMDAPQDVSVSVFNALGERVAFRNYGSLSGGQVLPFIGNDMENGFYFFQIQIGEKSTTQKVLMSK